MITHYRGARAAIQSNMSWIMLFLIAFAKAWPISSAMPTLSNSCLKC